MKVTSAKGTDLQKQSVFDRNINDLFIKFLRRNDDKQYNSYYANGFATDRHHGGCK